MEKILEWIHEIRDLGWALLVIVWVLSNFSPLGLSSLVEREGTELESGVASSSTSQDQDGYLNMYKAGQIQGYKAEVGSCRVHVPFKGIQIQIKKNKIV